MTIFCWRLLISVRLFPEHRGWINPSLSPLCPPPSFLACRFDVRNSPRCIKEEENVGEEEEEEEIRGKVEREREKEREKKASI